MKIFASLGIVSGMQVVEELKNRIDSLQTEMNTKISDLESKITLSTGGTDKETVIREMDKIRTEYSEKISNLQTVIEGKIAENKVQIDGNTEQIEANTKAIGENAAAIAELKAKIEAGSGSGETEANAEKIAENTQKIADNAKAIADQAKLIAENASAITDNAAAIADNTKHIAALEQSLADTRSEITEAYKDAIKTAINELDGRLTGDAAAKVIEMNDRITSEVKTVNETIDALTKRVATLENEMAALKEKVSGYDTSIGKINDRIDSLEDRISEIIKKVVSISYIPSYSDCAENVSYTVSGTTITPGTFTLRFEIQPASLAAELASVWSSALSVKSVYTVTRASAGNFVTLDIKSATAADGILTVTVSANGLDNAFFKGTISAYTRLKISDGCSNEILSEYIKLKPIDSEGYVDKNGIYFGSGVIINGITWAPVNCGTSKDNLCGSTFTTSNFNLACPNGWRVPTKTELKSLVANYSALAMYYGYPGKWCSGNKKYTSSVSAIFLPMMDEGTSHCGRYFAASSTSGVNPYNYLFISDNGAEMQSAAGISGTRLWVRCVKN